MATQKVKADRVETIDDLARKLVIVADDILKGHIELPRAAEFNNTVGKLLSVYKVKLAAQAMQMTCMQTGLKMEDMPYLGDGVKKCLPS